jgi:hypothetical protein
MSTTSSSSSTYYYPSDETTPTPYTHPYIPTRLPSAPSIPSHLPSACRATLLAIHQNYTTITSVIESTWALESGPAHQVRPGTREADAAARQILEKVEEMRRRPGSVGLKRLTDMPQGTVDQVVEAVGVARRYLLLRGTR